MMVRKQSEELSRKEAYPDHHLERGQKIRQADLYFSQVTGWCLALQEWVTRLRVSHKMHMIHSLKDSQAPQLYSYLYWLLFRANTEIQQSMGMFAVRHLVRLLLSVQHVDVFLLQTNDHAFT